MPPLDRDTFVSRDSRHNPTTTRPLSKANDEDRSGGAPPLTVKRDPRHGKKPSRHDTPCITVSLHSQYNIIADLSFYILLENCDTLNLSYHVS